ncbi:MAG: recombination protein RecR [Clostridia bacterium]|nr:recombination protein RecR [Clostridia bacterium]
MPNINQLNKLIAQFGKLPGVGAKTAQKMAYFILAQGDATVREFAETLLASKDLIHCCPRCQNLTDQDLCPICADTKRSNAICVVEKPEDVEAMERTRTFHGTYHVLHGLISPVNGIGADQLKIRELLHRVAEETVDEVILATSPNVEGQATALYLNKLLKPFEVKVTGLALGIPVGGTLEYADSLTLTRAMENRRSFEG